MPEYSGQPLGYVIDSSENGNKGNIFYCHDSRGRYVVKEYNEYRFISPEEGEELSPIALQNNSRTQEWLEKMQKIVLRFQRFARSDSLLNIPLKVYRQGNYIFKVTNYCEQVRLDMKEIRDLPLSQIDLLMKTALLQLSLLGEHGFVHGDIKPENLIILDHCGTLVTCIIDYDGGFFLDDVGKVTKVDFTPEFAAPELKRFVSACNSMDTEKMHELSKSLGPLTDVYGMGCIFHNYLTGERMRLNSGIAIPFPLEPGRRALIRRMTSYIPSERPDAMTALRMLNDLTPVNPETVLSGLLSWPVPSDFKIAGETIADGPDEGKPLVSQNMELEEPPHISGILWHVGGWCRSFGKEKAFWHNEYRAAETRAAEAEKVRRFMQTEPGLHLLPFRILQEHGGEFAFERQPDGESLSLEELFGKLKKRPKLADGVIADLLSTLDALHGSGFLLGPVTDRSFRFFLQTSGARKKIVSYFGRMWRARSAKNRPLDHSDLDVSPEWLPPEVLNWLKLPANERQVSEAPLQGTWTDVWVMAKVWHYLLTGTMISSVRDLDPSLSLAHTVILKRALRSNWFQRSASCSDILHAITSATGTKARILLVSNGTPASHIPVDLFFTETMWAEAEKNNHKTVRSRLLSGLLSDENGVISLPGGVPYTDLPELQYLASVNGKQIPFRWEKQDKIYNATINIG